MALGRPHSPHMERWWFERQTRYGNSINAKDKDESIPIRLRSYFRRLKWRRRFPIAIPVEPVGSSVDHNYFYVESFGLPGSHQVSHSVFHQTIGGFGARRRHGALKSVQTFHVEITITSWRGWRIAEKWIWTVEVLKRRRESGDS